MPNRFLSITFICCSLLLSNHIAAMEESNGKNHVVGLSTGMVIPVTDSSLYVGSPANMFFDRDLGLVLSGNYFHKLSPHLWTGAYVELETFSGEDGAEKGMHSSLGLQWLARYPDKAFSMHAGGQLSLGVMTSNDWDNLFGIGYGLFFGPAVEFDNFGLALYFQTVFHWFQGDSPDEITAKDPRIRLHVYYCF